MKLLPKGSVLIASVCILLTGITTANARHATIYLDGLTLAVSNRLQTATTNKTALSKAYNALKKNTGTRAADLNALASAASALAPLNADEELAFLQADALSGYQFDAQHELEFVRALIDVNQGTNANSPTLNKKLTAATNALNTANSISGGIPAQARSLAQATTKLAALSSLVDRSYKAPPSLTGFDAQMIENVEHDPQRYWTWCRYEAGASEPFLQEFKSLAPEDVGRWTYERTGPNTGVIHLQADYADEPYVKHDHDLLLTFTSARGGTFAGEDVSGRAIRGPFKINRSENAPD